MNTLYSSLFFLHLCTHLALGGCREGEAELTVLPAKRGKRGGRGGGVSWTCHRHSRLSNQTPLLLALL